MATDLPPSLKPVQKYLIKAREVEKVEPVVSYYCLCYAVELGLQVRDKADPRASKFLGSLMDQMEAMKRSVGGQLGDAGRSHLENFIMGLFQKADEIDRAGLADKTTARMFNAVAVFWDVLKQWGPLQPDVLEKRKYALWKAADILGALKRGERPMAGPPGGNDAQQQQQSGMGGGSAGDYSYPYTDDPFPAEPSSYQPPPPAPPADSSSGGYGMRPPPREYAPPVVYPDVTSNEHAPTTYPTPSGPSVSLDDMIKAESEARSAASALQFQDVETAVACLQRALRILRHPVS